MVPAVEAAIIAAITSVVVTILPKIIDKIQEVLKEQKGLKHLVENTLTSQLSIIQAVILDNRREIIRSNSGTSQTFRTWIHNLRCFAYDMEDCIDGYWAKTITGGKLYDKIARLQASAKGLSTDLKNIMEPAKGWKHDDVDPSSSTPTAQTPSNQSYDLGKLVGNVQHLQDLLFPSKGSEAKVIVISIISFGGRGKTNLCEKVYKEVLWKHHFPRCAFVSAAGKGKKEVLEEIIRTLHEQSSTSSSWFGRFRRQGNAQDGNGGNVSASTQASHQVESNINILAECLGGNSYLIAVDDVESEELGKYISCAFPQDNKGSRIIMAMNVLGPTAETGDMSKTVWEFQTVGSSSPTSLSLLMTDRGVPHALVSISGVDRGHFNADNVDEAWSQFREKEADRWQEEIGHVFSFGYDNLPYPKDNTNLYIPRCNACLLYFAMFPGGIGVKRGSLIRRWLSEGLELGGANSKDAGENLDFIDRKIIRPLHLSLNQDQHVRTCQPPRVVLDKITEISEEESFIMLSSRSSLKLNYTRRLSLHPTSSCEGQGNAPNVYDLPPRLRTLAVSPSTDASSVAKCEQLRVLDMEAYPGLEESQLAKICDRLSLLKYLSLRADIINVVPESIGNLKCLETLDLGKDKDKVIKVPIQVLELPCLINLFGKFKLFGHNNPKRFLRASDMIKGSRLETLAGFVTSKGQGFPPLMHHMKKLQKVKIWFCHNADAKSIASYLPAAITKFLQREETNRSLSLDFPDRCKQLAELLNSLDQASGKLYSLKLCAKNLSEIPRFVTNNKMTGITKLCLSWGTMTLDATFLDSLSMLEDLKYLKLVADTIEGAYDENPQANDDQTKVVAIKTRHIKNVQQVWLVAQSRLPEIQIEPEALESLDSIYLISEDTNSPSANAIRNTANHQDNSPLKNLKKVTLNAAVSPQTKKDWYRAARDHHKCPRVQFIEHPHPRHSG